MLCNVFPKSNDSQIEKMRRKLDAENEELRSNLEETEGMLTVEENKTSRLTLELSQLKMELEKRLAEKDDDSDKDRKNLLRQVDSLHTQLEDETKVKNDLVKARKMAESEVAGLTDDLESAERTISTLNGNLGKQQKGINELQMALEDSNKNGENLKQALVKSDKKLSSVNNQKSEIEAVLEKAEKNVKNLNNERAELQAQAATHESAVSSGVVIFACYYF